MADDDLLFVPPAWLMSKIQGSPRRFPMGKLAPKTAEQRSALRAKRKSERQRKRKGGG